MDIPEYIWSNIESKNLIFASQLYIIGRFIYHDLLFEKGSYELENTYLIASKQWDVIKRFENIILNECNNVLQSLTVQAEVGIRLNVNVCYIFLDLMFISEYSQFFSSTCVIIKKNIPTVVGKINSYAQIYNSDHCYG